MSPTSRVERLAELYKPKKKTPATVEFADLAGPGRTGAQALLDVAPYRAADALVHVVRAFRDPSVTHHADAINPASDAQAMEDELLLADLAVVEKRLERIDRDMKKGRTTELERERVLIVRCKDTLENGLPLRGLELTDDERKMLRGFQFLSAKPLLLVVNLDEADVALLGDGAKAADAVGLTPFLSRAATGVVAVCAKIELEIGQLEAGRRAGVPRRPRPVGARREPRDPDDVRPARVHLVPHGGRGRVPGVVDPARHARAAGGRRDSLGHRPRASSAPRSSASST